MRAESGLETAFRAELGRAAKPKVTTLAKYDALPKGHACGHSLIAGAALAAAVGLVGVRDQLPGEVVVLGTPGEVSVATTSPGQHQFGRQK